MARKRPGSKQHSAVHKTLAGIIGSNGVCRTPTISPANLSDHVGAALAAAQISCSASLDPLQVGFKAAVVATIQQRGAAILRDAVSHVQTYGMSQPAIQHKRILLTQADRKEHVESGKQHRSSSLSTELRPEHLVSELCPEFQSVLDLLDSDS